MTSDPYLLRSTRESDHPLVRAFRVENATEHPISYGATLETTLAMTDDDWRLRARRGEQEDAASVVAIERSSGRWVGMMSAQSHDDDGADPVLTGVYVLPDHRGKAAGVADRLLAHVLDWALEERRRGSDRMSTTAPHRPDVSTPGTDSRPQGVPACTSSRRAPSWRWHDLSPVSLGEWDGSLRH
ncbi:GNAT family N-acetyltransferase [Microbacterium sp. KUDC0406]|uniref:GNAT family N-acetyltransferase n=1 Tax=Microbacterium sp. KUDC0406 TaxID=2909588 RepID=UPI001F2E275E|nr:GNAT family N-acetyltransferase [Microbacterium sp. KUDC0406]UJP11049.1 GNAT family N-acetyltransferase [Microbacterium sp. KUDC0406]